MESRPAGLRLPYALLSASQRLGLTLPGLLRIKPWLVWLAALGLVPIMAGAAVMHATRGETSAVVTTTVLLVLVAATAYARWKVVPLPSRTSS